MSGTTEHVFLVAVVVEGDANLTREQAEHHLHGVLPKPYSLRDGDPRVPQVQEWWVAEHDRRDGSDNDSAEFVPYRPSAIPRAVICI